MSERQEIMDMFVDLLVDRNQLRAENERQAAELAKWREACREMVEDSDGIAGWHLNGDILLWDEFLADWELTLTEPDSPKPPDSPNGENAGRGEFPEQENTEERK